MELLEPTREAFRLLFTGDAGLWRIIMTSLVCSVTALVLIAPPSVALGFLITKVVFPGRRALVVLVAGIAVVSNRGDRASDLHAAFAPRAACFLKLLFTPEAIIVGTW